MVTGMELAAGLNSLKMAKDMIQAMSGVYTATQINDVKFTLQGHILDAQQALFAAQQQNAALIEKVSALKAEIASMKDWSAEKAKYELADAGNGTFAYRSKEAVGNAENPMLLCPNCFENSKPSILQPEKHAGGTTVVHKCPACKAELITRGHRANVHMGGRR